jgi:hypothetical protein
MFYFMIDIQLCILFLLSLLIFKLQTIIELIKLYFSNYNRL